jgi:hypothetical protein
MILSFFNIYIITKNIKKMDEKVELYLIEEEG